MKSEILIRPFAEADRSALEVIAAEIVEDGTVFPFTDVAGVLRYWGEPGAAVFVATADDVVVGSYTLQPNQADRGSHVANAGYMVSEAYRNQGIGEKLGLHSIETARSHGYLAMQFSYVVSTNRSAVRLWERLGFEILAEVPESFRHPHKGLVGMFIMHRAL